MSKSNKTNYGKETKRILKVSTNVGGFVAKLATKNLLGISHKEKNAEELMQLLGNLKGPIMKVAQILSTIPEAIPEEYAKKLSMLQAEAPSMGWLFVKRRMRAELGDDWQKKFIKFEIEIRKSVPPSFSSQRCLLYRYHQSFLIETQISSFPYRRVMYSSSMHCVLVNGYIEHVVNFRINRLSLMS